MKKQEIEEIFERGAKQPLNFQWLGEETRRGVRKKLKNYDLRFDGNDEFWIFKNNSPLWRSSDYFPKETVKVWNWLTTDTLTESKLEKLQKANIDISGIEKIIKAYKNNTC